MRTWLMGLGVGGSEPSAFSSAASKFDCWSAALLSRPRAIQWSQEQYLMRRRLDPCTQSGYKHPTHVRKTPSLSRVDINAYWWRHEVGLPNSMLVLKPFELKVRNCWRYKRNTHDDLQLSLKYLLTDGARAPNQDPTWRLLKEQFVTFSSNADDNPLFYLMLHLVFIIPPDRDTHRRHSTIIS